MDYFPVFLDSKRIRAIIIGGGDVAARKIELLLKSTTSITIISPKINATVERLINLHQLTWHQRVFAAEDIGEVNLVISATDDSAVNEKVSNLAQQKNILVNVVDQPELCSYITPAIVDRSPMLVAISSSGSSPVLVRMLREKIDKILPAQYGKLAEFCFKFRDHVKARVKGVRNRRLFWEQMLRGNIGQDILVGKTASAEQQLIVSLKQEVPPPSGDIVFIHTLDGNPECLTLAAHRELQFADAVFYDQDVNPELLEYVRRDAEKYPQDISSTIMVNYQHAIELAEQGLKIIYLLNGATALPQNQALDASSVGKKTFFSGT
ncbi:NAD(P)-dependent oxidoreductase [Thalassotalea atypica]|uniref:NAD(P)-dependent oxidoreductase n=1 Tax=Thalassotalea atypica TaxID=2054316 RepID=UPI002572B5B7|nr:NAD(P)-dependent oxidoreductase [Thalassotalea atypica]